MGAAAPSPGVRALITHSKCESPADGGSGSSTTSLSIRQFGVHESVGETEDVDVTVTAPLQGARRSVHRASAPTARPISRYCQLRVCMRSLLELRRAAGRTALKLRRTEERLIPASPRAASFKRLLASAVRGLLASRQCAVLPVTC